MPSLLVHLRLEYADGTTDAVTTGPDWQSATSPLLWSDLLMGEAYDARLDRSGWATTADGDDNFATWDVVTRDVPGVTGFMYTTWQNRYDDLERYGRLLTRKN